MLSNRRASRGLAGFDPPCPTRMDAMLDVFGEHVADDARDECPVAAKLKRLGRQDTRRLGTTVLVAAGYALASVLTVLVRPDVSPPNWLHGVLGVVCVVAVLAWGMFVRARRQLALVERKRAATAQQLRVAQARQMERNRIAREMHDLLAHRLSLLSPQAGALELWPDAARWLPWPA